MKSRDSGSGLRGSGEWSRFGRLHTRYSGLRVLIILGWLLTWNSSGSAQKAPAGEALPNQRITIWVHDYARTKPGTLARAEKEAARIFGEAGVNLAWQSYSPWPGGPVAEAAPQAVSDVPHIHLSIVTRSKAYALPYHEETLGITPMSREGERGMLAEIFLDRVRYQADPAGVSVGLLLGHAIAHELGHVLLRTGGHVPTGIMRARWTPQDLHRAACGQLLFTPHQAELIRNEVRERTHQQAAIEVAASATSK